MLFNKEGEGAQELQQLTGSYYANNDFTRINNLVQLAEDKLIQLLGQPLYDRLDQYYNGPEGSGSSGGGLESDQQLDAQLLNVYRTPIAYMASFEYYQTNLVSHEDGGRKVKLDKENESIAWEWMIDKDDEAQLKLIGETKDRLIRFLDQKKVEEWIQSDNRKALRKLFVNTTEVFNDVYPIDNSTSFFFSVLPFIREVHRKHIKPALGSYYAGQLSAWQQYNPYEVEEGSGSAGEGLQPDLDHAMIDLIHNCVPLLVMVLAVKRKRLQALPYGLVQQFKSMIQSRNGSQVPLPEVIKDWIQETQTEAMQELDKLKSYVLNLDQEEEDRQYLPVNDSSNKFMRT